MTMTRHNVASFGHFNTRFLPPSLKDLLRLIHSGDVDAIQYPPSTGNKTRLWSKSVTTNLLSVNGAASGQLNFSSTEP